MLHNELAEKNLQLKALQEHLQDYKVLKYMSKQTERDAAKSADEVRTCKNEITKLRKELATEKQARANVESKYSKLVTQIAKAKRAAKAESEGQETEPQSGNSAEPKSVSDKDPASTPEPNSNATEPQTEEGNSKSTADDLVSGASETKTEKRASVKKSSPDFIARLDETDILSSIAELGLGSTTAADEAVTADDGLSPRLPTLLGEESFEGKVAEGKPSGATGSTALDNLGSGASGLLSPSPTSGNNRTTTASAAAVGSTGGVVDLTYMTQSGSTGNPKSEASMGSRDPAKAQNEMHGVISTWGRKVCKGRIRPTSSAEFANYEFSFDLQDVDPEVEATFYIGDPVVFVALRGYNELRAVNVRLAKPRIGLPPAIFPTNNYFYYIYDIPVTNLSNIDAKLKHELKTRQVMTEYDLLDCYLKVVGQAFHENNITYFGIVSFSEVESYKNFYRRLADCNANETDPAKKPPMKVAKTRPCGRLEFW
jgi:hypothetical protein